MFLQIALQKRTNSIKRSLQMSHLDKIVSNIHTDSLYRHIFELMIQIKNLDL